MNALMVARTSSFCRKRVQKEEGTTAFLNFTEQIVRIDARTRGTNIVKGVPLSLSMRAKWNGGEWIGVKWNRVEWNGMERMEWHGMDWTAHKYSA